MHEFLLSFFVNLMIFTGGLITLLFVIILFIVLAVEIYDFFVGDRQKPNDSSDDDSFFDQTQ